MACSNAGQGARLGGMVNKSESAINSVSFEWLKLLTSHNQKVSRQVLWFFIT